MRTILLSFGLLALASCGGGQPTTPAASGCAREATHTVEWSAEGDVVTASSSGPSCAQAVVTLVVRNASGDPLWAFASTYYDLTAGGVGPEGAPPVSDEQMDTFLSGWANVSMMRASALPEWREGATSLTESAEGFSYDTAFPREAYDMMRRRDLPLLCYAAAAEASQCLIIDPASGAPALLVSFGP